MKKGLLITSDEKIINFILQSRINNLYNFSLCTDLFQGLKILSKREYDVLIYDSEASSMNPRHAVQTVKKLYQDLHIIIVAGEEFQKKNQTLHKNSIDYLLFKPLDIEDIYQHLKFMVDVNLDKFRDQSVI